MPRYQIVNWDHYMDPVDPWCPLCHRRRSQHQDDVEVRFQKDDGHEAIFHFCSVCVKTMAETRSDRGVIAPYLRAFTEALERKRFSDGSHS